MSTSRKKIRFDRTVWRGPRFWIPMASALLIICLPSRNLWMGDGYPWLDFFTDNPEWKVMALNLGGGSWLYFIPMILYKVFGFGTAYVFGLIYFVYALLLSRIDRRYLLLFCLPIIQVFAGYIEIYAGVYALSVTTYYYHITQQRLSFVVTGVLTFFCHIVVGLPILVLVSGHLLRKREYIAAGAVMSMSAAYIFMINQIFRRESAFFALDGYYSVFSSVHLLELALLMVFLFFWTILNWEKLRRVEQLEMYPAALASLGLTAIIVPHIGMFRDWDLMSMSLLPVTFLYLASVKRLRTWVLIFLLAFTTGWMSFNHSNPQETMLSYMMIAPQYSPRFFNGNQLLKTIAVYNNQLDDKASWLRLFDAQTDRLDGDSILRDWRNQGIFVYDTIYTP